MKEKMQVLNQLPLKIIALLTMTIDHIGFMMRAFGAFPAGSQALIVSDIFRMVGRIAFPLFIFMLAEGLHKSHDRLNYLLRLSIFWAGIAIAELIISAAMPNIYFDAQAFTDLIMFALVIYLIEHPKKPLRFLAILPFAYIILSFVAGLSEAYAYSAGQISVWSSYFPTFMRCGYSLYGFLMFLGIYYAPVLVKKVTSHFMKGTDIDLSEWTEGPKYQGLINSIANSSIIIVTLIFWLLQKITGLNAFLYLGTIQSYCVIACLFITFYNGKRGWDRKWFRYLQYFYYPLHMVLIYGVFALFF